jgi:hypothetical protein
MPKGGELAQLKGAIQLKPYLTATSPIWVEPSGIQQPSVVAESKGLYISVAEVIRIATRDFLCKKRPGTEKNQD